MERHNGERVFALKTIRIWFKKIGTAKYISHLDLNRFMAKVIQKSGLPIWWTEGFNPHPFVTFALPLSLGFSGECESMDVKILDETLEKSEIIERFNSCFPEGIIVYDVTDPVMKPKDIGSALFDINIYSENNTSQSVYDGFKEMFDAPEINILKKTKKDEKVINVKPNILSLELTKKLDCVNILIRLSAGSEVNINPNLLIDKVSANLKDDFYVEVTRKKIYNKNDVEFK